MNVKTSWAGTQVATTALSVLVNCLRKSLRQLKATDLSVFVSCLGKPFRQLKATDLVVFHVVAKPFTHEATSVGGFIVRLLGGYGFLLCVLTSLIVINYIIGVLSAIAERNLSSEIGVCGIIKNISMFLLVGVAHIADGVVGSSGIIRTETIMYFISNEGLSLLENVTRIGTLVTFKLKDILTHLRQHYDDGGNSK